MLPSKTVEVVHIPFDSVSKGIYNNILATQAGAKKMDQRAAAHLFTQLRKAANSPLLLRTRWIDKESVDVLVKWTMACDYWGNDRSLTEDLVRSQVGS